MNAYVDQLMQLQPPGMALTTDPESAWVKLLEGVATEFARIDGRSEDLVAEVTLAPTANELLDAWESIVQEPVVGDLGTGTNSERVAGIRSALAAVGGQSVSYFMDIIRQFNVPADIQECRPFEVGRDGMGDPVGGEEWLYIWRVLLREYVPAETVQAMTRILNKHKPAHTIVTVRFEIPPPTDQQSWYLLAGFTAQ